MNLMADEDCAFWLDIQELYIIRICVLYVLLVRLYVCTVGFNVNVVVVVVVVWGRDPLILGTSQKYFSVLPSLYTQLISRLIELKIN
jgi:hypothetical protein